MGFRCPSLTSVAGAQRRGPGFFGLLAYAVIFGAILGAIVEAISRPAG